MRIKFICLLVLLVPPLQFARAQSTVPTFQQAAGQGFYTLLGQDPARGGATTIPTVLVPMTLSFDAKKTAGKPFIMAAAQDVPRILRSPVFSKFAFPSGGTTQYADAMLQTTFPTAAGWHTLLGKPEVKPVMVTVPVGYGYILTSKKTGDSIAVVDIEFLQKELFRQLPKQEGKLVIAMTHNTTYYADGDATVCCSWGTHGVDSATENSFVLSSYLQAAPTVVEDGDVQPLTQQLAELITIPCTTPCSTAATSKFQETPCPVGCVRETRVAAVARASPPPISFWNPQIRIPRTISPHRRPLSPIWTEPPITCRTWHCCPGTRAPLRVSAVLTAPQTRSRSPPLPSRARHGVGVLARAVVHRRLLRPRSRRSRGAARRTATGARAARPGV